jgi:hypothetical protein
MNRLIGPAVVALAIAGCAAPIEKRNAEAHFQPGYAAMQRGDWDAARRQFAQAVANADLGGVEPVDKAIMDYEYGRALGVTCFWEESEKYLLLSKQLDEQRGRSPFRSLYELALLTEREGKLAQAAYYFGQLIPFIEKEGLRTKYPLGVADVDDHYAARTTLR